jgi:hypothetical protein
MKEKTRQEIIAEHDRPTMVGELNGNLDYPSSKGLGVDTIDYLKRNPHPTEHNPVPTRVKVRDLPHLIVRDLEDAAAKGELRSELHRHVGLLEARGYADVGTIKLLRGYESDLTGHAACDRDQLDTITAVIRSCGPREVPHE